MLLLRGNNLQFTDNSTGNDENLMTLLEKNKLVTAVINQTRLMVPGNGEKGADHLLPLADPLAAQRRRGDGEEGGAGLVRDGLADQSLPCRNETKNAICCSRCCSVLGGGVMVCFFYKRKLDFLSSSSVYVPKHYVLQHKEMSLARSMSHAHNAPRPGSAKLKYATRYFSSFPGLVELLGTWGLWQGQLATHKRSTTSTLVRLDSIGRRESTWHSRERRVGIQLMWEKKLASRHEKIKHFRREKRTRERRYC